MKVFEVGVSVNKKIDIGYRPYLQYLESLSGRRPEFGTRENSTIELSGWAKAEVGEGEDMQVAISALIQSVNQVLENEAAAMGGISDTGNDPYAFTTSRVNIDPVDGDF